MGGNRHVSTRSLPVAYNFRSYNTKYYSHLNSVLDLLLTSFIYSKETLLKGLYAIGFKTPSKIQAKALPHLLSDPPPNMIGQSRSGTGKTGAFLITMLSCLDYSKPHQPQAMCIAPTRELADQIYQVLKLMGQFYDGAERLTAHLAVSHDPNDPNPPPPIQPVHAMVIVGTPGRMEALVAPKKPSHAPLADISQLKVVVLDEADAMLSQQGHGDSSLRIRRFVIAIFKLCWIQFNCSIERFQDIPKSSCSRRHSLATWKDLLHSSVQVCIFSYTHTSRHGNAD